MNTSLRRLAHFLQTEAASGIFLFLATLLTLFMANISSLRGLHGDITHALHLPVNDGLMVIFFFLIGLEIRREMQDGFLSSWRKAALPVVAAIGGMAVPALVYLTIARDHDGILRGWAIPAATDIAFALAVLSLLGARVPVGLRVFLLALAVIDDLGAILIIALFYTNAIDPVFLGAAALLIAAMYLLNKKGIQAAALFIGLGIALAAALYLSGVHTTVAGVITAFFIPAQKREALIHHLHKPVAFAIMPLFAFVNAGLYLDGVSLNALLSPLPFAIAASLFLGKSLGVFGASWIAVKTKLSSLPQDVSWEQIYGMSILCGIGFTMSLFIGILAFGAESVAMQQTQLGVLAGSLLSSVAGYAFLRFFGSRSK